MSVGAKAVDELVGRQEIPAQQRRKRFGRLVEAEGFARSAGRTGTVLHHQDLKTAELEFMDIRRDDAIDCQRLLLLGKSLSMDDCRSGKHAQTGGADQGAPSDT